MKSSLLAWSLFSLAIVPSLATSLYKRQEETDEVEDGPTNTIFNGIEVPPEMELGPDNFKSTIADGYWYVLTTRVMSESLSFMEYLTIDQIGSLSNSRRPVHTARLSRLRGKHYMSSTM
jgi:hypothetical protein